MQGVTSYVKRNYWVKFTEMAIAQGSDPTKTKLGSANIPSFQEPFCIAAKNAFKLSLRQKLS
jgi:hypothetical protein